MARVTIEDTLKNCDNMFDLIQLASKRAHQLQRGATALVNRVPDNKGIEDAPTVLALREIAAGFVNFDNVVIPRKNVWGEDVIEYKPTPEREKAIVAMDRKKEE